jgi:hypothetical protein
MIRAMICCVVFLVLGTGCTTIGCNVTQTGEEELTAVVESSGSALAQFAGQAVKINGESLTALIGRRASDNEFSEEEKADIVEEATDVATKYIKENSEKFCNTCADGKPCQAEVESLEVELVSSGVVRNGNGWRATLVFKTVFKIRCGACLSCEQAASSQSGAATEGDPATCEGTPTVEYFRDLISYSTPVDALEGSSASIPDAVTE